MRTTLKRGIGRGAEFDGNGRSVFPPAALGPVKLYRQPERERPRGWRRVARFLFLLAAVLAMVAGGLAGGAYLWAHETVASTAPHTRAFKKASRRLDPLPSLPGQPANALLIGSDHRIDEDGARSDTVMLLRADPQAKTVSMLSFPRDLVVPLRCPGRFLPSDRINQAFTLCGPQGTLETVRALTNLPIHYLVQVNFRGFRQVVDHLGGVWVDVDRRYYNDNRGLGPGYTYATINLKPGYQLLNGSQALAFVRYRHTDNDLIRNARQQLFVRGMKERLSNFSVFEALRIVGTVARNTEIGRSGARGISFGTAKSFGLLAYRLPGGHFFQVKLQNLVECGQSNAELCPGSTSVSDAVQEFVHPDLDAANVASRSLGIRRARAGPKPSRVRVLALNGYTVPGAASDASYRLAQRGYHTVKPAGGGLANAPNSNFVRSRIYFDPHQPRAHEAALDLRKVVGAMHVGTIPRGISRMANGAMLVLVIGKDFQPIGPPPPARVTRPEPPAVRVDPRATLAALRKVRRQLPFRLEVPSRIESTSQLAAELPVRVYTVAPHHRAVRLTFVKPQGCSAAGLLCEYWGIEQTDWADAPVLKDANFTHRTRGREFHFYYAGSHLHMIVLKESGAAYWVVNTLADSLSNATMLAIAKGLTPLGSQTRR